MVLISFYLRVRFLYFLLCFMFLLFVFFLGCQFSRPFFSPFFPGANQYTTVKERGQNRTRTEQSRRGGAKKNEAKHHVHLSCFFVLLFGGLISASKFELFALVFFSFCLCKNTDDERKIVERYTFTRLLRHSSLNSIVFPVFRGYRKK